MCSLTEVHKSHVPGMGRDYLSLIVLIYTKGNKVKSITEAVAWCKYHPIKLVVLSLLWSVGCFCVYGVADKIEDRQFCILLTVMMSTFFLLASITMVERDIAALRRKGVVSIIIFALLGHGISVARAQEVSVASWSPTFEYPLYELSTQQGNTNTVNSGGAIVGGALVACGALAAFYFYKFCQRKFAKTTNATPDEEFRFSVGDEGECDEEALSAAYASMGSCAPDDVRGRNLSFDGTPLATPQLTRLQLTGVVQGHPSAPEFRITALDRLEAADPDEIFQDINGFQRDLQSHGIQLGDTSIGTVFYGKRGQPTSAENVKVAFDANTREFIVDRTATSVYRVMVQRSYDLVAWEDMARTSIPHGHKVRFDDIVTASAVFYRLVPIALQP